MANSKERWRFNAAYSASLVVAFKFNIAQCVLVARAVEQEGLGGCPPSIIFE